MDLNFQWVDTTLKEVSFVSHIINNHKIEGTETITTNSRRYVGLKIMGILVSASLKSDEYCYITDFFPYLLI